jgi:hypothetical protein
MELGALCISRKCSTTESHPCPWVFETGSHYIAEAGLELMSLLPSSPGSGALGILGTDVCGHYPVGGTLGSLRGSPAPERAHRKCGTIRHFLQLSLQHMQGPGERSVLLEAVLPSNMIDIPTSQSPGSEWEGVD